MPRHSRYFVPGVPAHIIQRGNDRQACFFAERDFVVYLSTLREFCLKFKVLVHSYVLMTNHVHLLCTPCDSNGISKMMQSLGRCYVRYVNSTYERTGTLWEGRFRASLVESDRYLLAVSRYIELNPVRAGMVDHPAEYPWSSYRYNGVGKPVKLLTPHPIYRSLGQSDHERQSAYRALFSTGNIPNYPIEAIREATNKSWVLGDGKFKQQIEAQLGRRLPPLPRGGDRKSNRRQR